MTITVHPSKIEGQLKAPASKSYAQRVLAAALLAKGTSIIKNPSRCDDALAAMKVIQQLGAQIQDYDDRLIVEGGFNPNEQKLNCGEAGLGIRMFPVIASLAKKPMVITGTGSLFDRPVHMVEDALNQLKVSCKTRNGFIPIWIKGPLKGGELTIDGSLSSQILTGLLMTLPVAKKSSVIHVKDLKSSPYIDMTLEVMEQFGIQGSNHHFERFEIPGKQKYQATEISIEGDWSGVAFQLVAGVLGGSITVNGIKQESKQADKEILKALQLAGTELRWNGDSLSVSRPEILQPFEFDALHCPDLFPPLVALAAHCKGTSKISGVQRLKHKESNRARVLQDELGKMGVPIRFDPENMYINGPAKVRTATIDPHRDHRIAMAAAVSVLSSNASVTIEDAECVSKSYPDFYSDLKSVGGQIDE